MPSTQTSCPAQGTARAAVTALLVLGTHQNLVYSTRLGAISNATSYTLKRYDTTTGQTTEIVKLDNTEISNAQISTDGQWVLFTSTVNGQAAIQMIRMDGQGLQTLYCNPVKPDPTNSLPASISSIAWSVDQKLAMFSESDNSNNPPTLYLLNLANGTVQKELLPDSASSTIYYPTLWIDATHVALSASDLSGTSGQSIYVLDISKGANQQSVSLQLIVKATTSCLNFDINPAHTKFFLSRCTMDRSLPNFNAQGPSSISVLPVTGGSEQTIFTTQTLGVTGIRVISNTELLVLITTKGFSSGIDSSKNGLYKMHVDGTHFTQLIGNDLIGNDGHQFVSLNGPSATWSIVSRDGRMYALEIAWCGNACTYTLLFGSLSGGKPTTIISGNSINGNASTLVGWTTM